MESRRGLQAIESALKTQLWLFAGTLLIYSMCPPFTSNDIYYAVPTALSLLRHGSTAVDEFVPGSPAEARYSLECVPAHGPAVGYDAARGCSGGHWYNIYPLGTSLMALPFVALLQLLSSSIAWIFPRAHTLIAQPIVSAFLNGDLIRGHALAELWSAAPIAAAAAVVVYRIAARFLARGYALAITLVFAFGTTQWSTASRSLWQHGPTVLLLALSLYLLLEDRVEIAGFTVASLFLVRATNAIPVAVLTLYVALHYRRRIWKYLTWASPVAAFFFTYNLWVLHSPISAYYLGAGQTPVPWFWGLAVELVSPSRGLLVFTPAALIAVAGGVIAIRRRWCFPLAGYVAAIAILEAALGARFWPGHCYGPRYFADMAPVLAFFSIPAVASWAGSKGNRRAAAKWTFLALAGWSVVVNGEGAVSAKAQFWNETPAEVDVHKERAWDWGDPQFLRGFR